MFKIGDKVKVKNNLSMSVLTTLNNARVYEDTVYKIAEINLSYNNYYGGPNQLLKFRHSVTAVPAEYFDIIRVSVGFMLD